MAMDPDLQPARRSAGPCQSWVGAVLGKACAPRLAPCGCRGPVSELSPVVGAQVWPLGEAGLTSWAARPTRVEPLVRERSLAVAQPSPPSSRSPALLAICRAQPPAARPLLTEGPMARAVQGPPAEPLGGQTSQHPTQGDSLPCFTDGFCKLLTVWTAVAPWGSPFSLPGGGQRELESPTRGLLCPDRRGYDWGTPLSSVLWGLCHGQGWTSSAPPCRAGVPAEPCALPRGGLLSLCEGRPWARPLLLTPTRGAPPQVRG